MSFQATHLIGFGVGAAAGIGGIDSFTKLMLHCDGSDGSTTFTDSSASAHSITVSGNAQIDTAQSKFGGASGLFDGTGDLLTTPSSTDFAFGTGTFTLDAWVRFNSVAGFLMTIFQFPTPDMRLIGYNPGSPVVAFYAASGIQITGTTVLSTGTWYHVAVARSGTSTKLFLNGTQEGSTYSDSNDYSSSAQTVKVASQSGSWELNGWLDEIRISKGVARWTANFTPPTAPYDAG